MIGHSSSLLKLIAVKEKKKLRREVAKPAEIVNGELKIYRKKLTMPEAITVIRIGDGVIARTKDSAFKIASGTSGGKRPIGPEIHGIGRGFRLHYHTDPRNGSHVWF